MVQGGQNNKLIILGWSTPGDPPKVRVILRSWNILCYGEVARETERNERPVKLRKRYAATSSWQASLSLQGLISADLIGQANEADEMMRSLFLSLLQSKTSNLLWHDPLFCKLPLTYHTTHLFFVSLSPGFPFFSPFPWLPGDGHLQNPHGFDDDLPRRVHAYAHLDGNAVSPSARLFDGRGAGDHEAGDSLKNGAIYRDIPVGSLHTGMYLCMRHGIWCRSSFQSIYLRSIIC